MKGKVPPASPRPDGCVLRISGSPYEGKPATGSHRVAPEETEALAVLPADHALLFQSHQVDIRLVSNRRHSAGAIKIVRPA